MFTVEAAFNRIEVCYERMQEVTSTSGRRYNYEEIIFVMNNCPAMKDYWRIREANKYTERVVKIKNYKEPTKTMDKFRSWLGESFDFREYEACAYILFLEDENMIKVGKTVDLKRRVRQLTDQYGNIEVLHTFGFNNEEDAYLMEVILHKYYKKYYKDCEFCPQDRFKGAGLNNTDIQILESAAEKIRIEKWF